MEDELQTKKSPSRWITWLTSTTMEKPGALHRGFPCRLRIKYHRILTNAWWRWAMQIFWDWSCEFDLVKIELPTLLQQFIHDRIKELGFSQVQPAVSPSNCMEFKVCHWIFGWLWNVNTDFGRQNWKLNLPQTLQWRTLTVWWFNWQPAHNDGISDNFRRGRVHCEFGGRRSLAKSYFFIEPHHIPLWCLELHALQYIDEFIRTAWWFEWNEIKWNVTLKARKPKCLRD